MFIPPFLPLPPLFPLTPKRPKLFLPHAPAEASPPPPPLRPCPALTGASHGTAAGAAAARGSREGGGGRGAHGGGGGRGGDERELRDGLGHGGGGGARSQPVRAGRRPRPDCGGEAVPGGAWPARANQSAPGSCCRWAEQGESGPISASQGPRAALPPQLGAGAHAQKEVVVGEGSRGCHGSSGGRSAVHDGSCSSCAMGRHFWGVLVREEGFWGVGGGSAPPHSTHSVPYWAGGVPLKAVRALPRGRGEKPAPRKGQSPSSSPV